MSNSDHTSAVRTPNHVTCADAPRAKHLGCTPGTAQTPSVAARAKVLKPPHPRANLGLRAKRLRAIRVLASLFGNEKHEVIAALLVVSRTLALRWLDEACVDTANAPLGVLWSLDEYSFERFVAAVRQDRQAMIRERAR